MIGFYCTMKRGPRVAWLAGPFPTKEAADARVRDATNAACGVDPWAAFDSFGVTKVDRPGPDPLPPGVLNAKLGLTTTLA